MSAIKKHSEGLALVVLGSFNPTIIHPRWPVLAELLSPWGVEEPEQVTVDVVHKEITKLEFASGIIEVEPKRFTIRDKEISAKASDFCRGLFGEILTHTPIYAIGINYQVELEFPNASNRNKLGYALAPTIPWGDLSDALASEHGGLLAIQVRVPLPKKYKVDRWRDISVSPGISNRNRCLINVNSHFQISTESEPKSSGECIADVLATFDDCIQESMKISQHIWDLGGT